jgi:hypothetical protein
MLKVRLWDRSNRATSWESRSRGWCGDCWRRRTLRPLPSLRRSALAPEIAAGLFCLANTLDAAAQDDATNAATPLPEIKVTTNKQTPKPKRPAAKRGVAPVSQGASPATGGTGRQADHPAVRHCQCVRPDLRTARRYRHRRVRAAIRPTPRLLCRHFAKTLRACCLGMSQKRHGKKGVCHASEKVFS